MIHHGGRHKQVWSAAFILVGAVLLMINLGYLPKDYLAYWPALLIIFGLMGLSNIDGKKK